MAKEKVIAGDPSEQTDGLSLKRFYRIIAELEKRRGCKIWMMIHQSDRAHICTPTLVNVISQCESIGSGKKIELILHSPGGHPEIAYRVMKFFRRRFSEVNVIVPMMAKSAATLMCLAADNVYMGEFSELGPIDIQIDDQVRHGAKNFSPLNEFKSIEFMREQAIEWMHYYATIINARYGLSLKEGLRDSIPLVTGLLRPVFQQIDPLEMGEHRRALAISEGYARRMIDLVGTANARDIVRKLVWEYPSHDFCIDYEEAASLGLPVERLSADEDRILTVALLTLDEDESIYGFIPEQPKPTKSKQKRSVPKRTPATTKAPSRVNGRYNDSEAKRIRPS